MTILVVEDEARIAKRICRLSNNILQNHPHQIIVKDKLVTAIDYIHQNPIEVLILDLNLSGKDGFEVLKTLGSESFHTIIVSAHRDRALEAFDYGVVDFIAKPFDQERLEKAYRRVLDKQRSTGTSPKHLAIKKVGRIELLHIDQIRYIQGANIYTEIFLKDRPKEVSEKSLENLERILPSYFMRIHKSYIANLQEAERIRIEPGSKYSLLMREGNTLPIGRSRYKKLKEKYFF